MSERFETYQNDYATLWDSIQKRIQNAIPQAKGEQRRALINQTQRDFEEADEIIGQLDYELSTMPPDARAAHASKVRSFKDETKRAKKELTKLGLSERDQLLGSASGSHVVDFEGASMDQRGRLLHGTERLQEGSRRLEEAKRLALEAGMEEAMVERLNAHQT
ncbi:Vesicle transport through interaction with t-SNAREs 1A [Irineochytrium annulatum]|nr:Vesicle transport through interaction with t-SNAREs 1A [Irineochytrium annulatum]